MAPSKSIILTGASRGIGLAIAKFLLKESHKVFLVARTAEPLEQLKNEFPGQVEFYAGDLKDFEVCETSMENCLVCWCGGLEYRCTSFEVLKDSLFSSVHRPSMHLFYIFETVEGISMSSHVFL
jgi:hypothetical protein